MDWAELQAEMAADLIELRDNQPHPECQEHGKLVWDETLCMYMCLDCESEAQND